MLDCVQWEASKERVKKSRKVKGISAETTPELCQKREEIRGSYRP